MSSAVVGNEITTSKEIILHNPDGYILSRHGERALLRLAIDSIENGSVGADVEVNELVAAVFEPVVSIFSKVVVVVAIEGEVGFIPAIKTDMFSGGDFQEIVFEWNKIFAINSAIIRDCAADYTIDNECATAASFGEETFTGGSFDSAIKIIANNEIS